MHKIRYKEGNIGVEKNLNYLRADVVLSQSESAWQKEQNIVLVSQVEGNCQI